MRYITFMTLVFLISCTKSDSVEKKTLQLQITNEYYDPLQVTIDNQTTTDLSGLYTITGQGFTNFSAKEGDRITIKGKVTPNKKWGRHPLFLNEVSYDTTLTVDQNTSAIHYSAPANKVVQVLLSVITARRDKYVRGVMEHSGGRDSLFLIPPGDCTTWQTIGYFNPAQVQHITLASVRNYYGDTAPFTAQITPTNLWGGHDGQGKRIPAPSATASDQPNTYFYLVQ
jgi:hypothetical protein